MKKLNGWLRSMVLGVVMMAGICMFTPVAQADKITLKDGQEIVALVVAENPMFYVLRKYGEFRAVGKDKVEKIDRSPDAAREAGHEDQILLKDGLVVSGKIVREREDTGMYEIQIAPGKTSMFVYRPLIQVVFKAGKQDYPPVKP